MKLTSLLFGAASGALLLAAAAGANAQSWADSTTVSGRIYADFSNITSKVDGVTSNSTATSGIPAANGTGFDVKRFYVGIDHKFTDVWSMNVTTDFQYSSAISATEVYIKKAYIQGTFSPAFIVRAGSADLPWIPYAEDIYGSRYLEKTVSDRTGFGTSADWGLHVLGKLNDNFSYQVSAINGNGYKNPTRAKSMDIEGRLSAKFDQLNFAIGGYTGKLGQAAPGVATPQKASRFNALAAFTGDRLRAGVEYFSANDFSGTLVKSTTPDKADGTSVFGSFRITPEYSIFARADTAKLSKLLNAAKKDDYYNLGVEWNAFKGVNFSAIVKHDSLTPSAGHKVEANEVGVYSQFRF
ncbi:porin [Asticcacaulis solisilvae]|uniref:porin n=1 Tax=Asticcacaulis solisilvae TaxID=1217274 RepID=UPI003FD757E4